MDPKQPCARCGQEFNGLAIVFPGIHDDGPLHPECIAAAIAENPMLAVGRIPAELIGTDELLQMFKEVVEHPEKGKPLYDA